MSKNEWTDEGVREWNRIRAKVDGMQMLGMPFENTPTRIAAGPPPGVAPVIVGDDDRFAWIAPIAPIPSASGGSYTGGGALYTALVLIGAPIKTNPTTDLVIPLAPGEKLYPTQIVIAENSAEPNWGDPPSHWVPCGTLYKGAAGLALGQSGESPATAYYPAELVGLSNESPPRKIYRFFCPRPGPAAIAVIPGPGGGFTPGTGRYFGIIMQGAGVSVDPTTPFLASGQTSGGGTLDPGTALGKAGDGPTTPQCVWCNLFEAGQNASTSPKTQLVGADSLVTGFFVGIAVVGSGFVGGLLPMYYGHAAPTNTLFPVELSASGGSGGSDTVPVNWVYYLTIMNPPGVPPGVATTLVGSGYSPQVRGPNALGGVGAASWGMAYLDGTGKIVLFWAAETVLGLTKVVTWIDGGGTTHTLEFVQGRLYAASP